MHPALAANMQRGLCWGVKTAVNEPFCVNLHPFLFIPDLFLIYSSQIVATASHLTLASAFVYFIYSLMSHAMRLFLWVYPGFSCGFIAVFIVLFILFAANTKISTKLYIAQ